MTTGKRLPRSDDCYVLWHLNRFALASSGCHAIQKFACLPTGAELFFFLTIWCLIVVLPTNLTVMHGSAEKLHV